MASPESLEQALAIASQFKTPLNSVLERTRTMTSQELESLCLAQELVNSGNLDRSDAIEGLKVASRTGISFAEAMLRIENKKSQSASGPQKSIQILPLQNKSTTNKSDTISKPVDSSKRRDAQTLKWLVEKEMLSPSDAANVVRQCVLLKKPLSLVLKEHTPIGKDQTEVEAEESESHIDDQQQSSRDRLLSVIAIIVALALFFPNSLFGAFDFNFVGGSIAALITATLITATVITAILISFVSRYLKK